MIAFVRGRVASIGITSAVVEVGGIGIDVQCAPNTIADLRVGAEAMLPTSMVVREDSMTLYGFATDDEKQMFELVQTASGVGPKVAQAMLAVLSPDTIRQAIGSEDAKTLTQVPGIGQKGAQRIILELKDRVGVATTAQPAAGQQAGAWQGQVHAALVGLGWSAKEAEKAVAAVTPEAGSSPDIAVLLRSALRTLSKS